MNLKRLNSDYQLIKNIEVNVKWRKKQQTCFSTAIMMPFSIEKIWNVLTDYESHPKFIPGLVETHFIQNSSKTLRIKQVYRQSFLGIKLDSYCILDIIESYPCSISSKLIEGDFKVLNGCYKLESIESNGKPKTQLTYSLSISPKFALPKSILERNMRKSLPVMLVSVYSRVKEINANSQSN